MSIHSMTGHGRGEASFKGAKVIVEISAVNHRQFDLRLDWPPYLSFMENEVRQMIHASLARGSISCRCHINPGSQVPTQRMIIDQCLLRQSIRMARETARRHKVPNDLSVNSLFNIPGVIKLFPVNKIEKKLGNAVSKALGRALKSLGAMRAVEGRALAEGMKNRLDRLDMILTQIVRRAPEVGRQYRRQLHSLLASAADNLAIDKKIFREAVLLADRCSIAEELERSQSHLKQFCRLLAAKEAIGRTMDFLVQEMMREINTLGAKANDCAISNLVVKYKSELECIREQVQNIE